MSRKRTQEITIAFTESEWRKIREAAKGDRETPSEFIRAWALSGAQSAIEYEYTDDYAASNRAGIHLVS